MIDGRHVPGFEPIRALGDGRSSTVWLAAAEAGGQVALAIGRDASDPVRARFARESDALRRIGPPHTAAWCAEGACADGTPFLAMEYLPGGTLDDWLRSEPRVTPAAITRAGDALLAALAAVHARGIVHGAIGPARLFLRPGGSICAMTGFGGAPSLDCAAPEQRGGDRRVDHRADLYAVGVILYRLATGTFPFDGPTDAVDRGHLSLQPPRAGRRAAVSPLLDQLIADCLAKDPAERPSSAEALRGQLAACAGGAAAATVPGVGARPAAPRAMVRESIALVLADSTGSALELVDAATRCGGRLLHQRGRRYLFGFRAADRPAAVALAAAGELTRAGAGAALIHVDAALVETRGATPMIYSRAIDDPATFAPAAWSGVAITAEAAAELDGGAIAAARARVLGTVESASAEPPLVGRQTVLAAAADSCARCFSAARPAVWLAIGRDGSGRTRVLAELARRIGAAHPGARVVTASARGALTQATLTALRDESASRPVALLVDDLHAASPRRLELLDHAAIDGHPAALWIAAAAGPGVDPDWGTGGASHDRIELPGLDDTAARELAPGATAEVLRWSGTMPATLVELARAMPPAVPPVSVDAWLAARPHGRELTGSLAELYEACAVLEPPFSREELTWVQRAHDPASGNHPLADAGVGLDELVERGAIARASDGHRIAAPAVRRGLLDRIAPGRRRAIHRHAAAFWAVATARAADPIEAHGVRARHLAAAGDSGAAAAEYLDQARRQIEADRPADADRSLGHALELTGDPKQSVDLGRTLDVSGGNPRLVARVLAARGKLRAQAGDPRALDDLTLARQHAASLGDDALEIDVLIDIAAAADPPLADEALADAERRAHGSTDPRLTAAVRAARGRALLRGGDSASAAQELTCAAASGNVDATVLLPVALLRAGRAGEARLQFDHAIAGRESAGDARRLAQLLTDRSELWTDADRRRSDLRRAVAIARSHALAATERAALRCLIEDLRLAGESREALALAERAHRLDRRCGGRR